MEETIKKLNDDITRLTNEIRNQYPELIKYLDEIPDTIPNDQEMSEKALRKYKNTLEAMIAKYQQER